MPVQVSQGKVSWSEITMRLRRLTTSFTGLYTSMVGYKGCGSMSSASRRNLMMEGCIIGKFATLGYDHDPYGYLGSYWLYEVLRTEMGSAYDSTMVFQTFMTPEFPVDS